MDCWLKCIIGKTQIIQRNKHRYNFFYTAQTQIVTSCKVIENLFNSKPDFYIKQFPIYFLINL